MSELTPADRAQLTDFLTEWGKASEPDRNITVIEMTGKTALGTAFLIAVAAIGGWLFFHDPVAVIGGIFIGLIIGLALSRRH